MRLFAACLLLLLPLSLPAMELKISTLYPDGTSAVIQLREAGEEIRQRTDGRVSLRIYPGGVMGDDRAVQRRIRIGQLHGALAQGGAFAVFYKDSQVLNLPLVFRDLDEVDHVRATLDSEIRDGFRANGWEVFGPADGGFAYVMSVNPVATVTDLARQKVWLPSNDPAGATAARVFGVSPVVLDVSAVLTSLQTGIIDTFVAPPVAALTLQWHGRVNHLTEVPLLYTYGMLGIAGQHFRRLSEGDQEIVREVLNATFAEMDRREREGNLRAFEAVLAQGIEPVVPSTEQMAEWREYARRATDRLVDQGQVSREMVNRIEVLLWEYRAGQGE